MRAGEIPAGRGRRRRAHRRRRAAAHRPGLRHRRDRAPAARSRRCAGRPGGGSGRTASSGPATWSTDGSSTSAAPAVRRRSRRPRSRPGDRTAHDRADRSGGAHAADARRRSAPSRAVVGVRPFEIAGLIRDEQHVAGTSPARGQVEQDALADEHGARLVDALGAVGPEARLARALDVHQVVVEEQDPARAARRAARRRDRRSRDPASPRRARTRGSGARARRSPTTARSSGPSAARWCC